MMLFTQDISLPRLQRGWIGSFWRKPELFFSEESPRTRIGALQNSYAEGSER